jgi:3-hydroxymyristoyl/3-hydroxydecanoyl-(acyl carrier protein) dehydratase
MRFTLIDTILERSADRIVAVKQVSMAEEYLADHFPSFPILPGVMMVEAMVQAGVRCCPEMKPRVWRSAGAQIGQLVRPGDAPEVTLHKATIRLVHARAAEPRSAWRGATVDHRRAADSRCPVRR